MKRTLRFHLFKIIFLKLYILTTAQVSAQDKKVLAQSEYYKAEEAYNEGKYKTALSYLDKSEGYSGNNHLIQYLRVKSYYENRNYLEAQQAVAVFFNIIDPNLEGSSKYKEIVLLVSDINAAAESEAAKKEKERLAVIERKKQAEAEKERERKC